MTGFASATAECPSAAVAVTVRSVNHRFLDLQVRVPSAYVDLEGKLRAQVQQRLTRGRVELIVSVQARQAQAPAVRVDEALVGALASAVDRLRAAGYVQGALAPGDVLRIPQVLAVGDGGAPGDTAPDPDVVATIEAALGRALTDLETMRRHEGGMLGADLEARRATLAQLIRELQQAAEEGRVALEARLTERARELGAQVPVDQGALAQEIVRVAQRSDISEELARFRGHLAHWEALVAAPEACGRKLDFLLQEMNREINTLGAKADGMGVSGRIIAAKAELERMKEQVQNVE
ncbi:MAG: YicC/YloC family endoribonuclease [Vicinamibacterales bacterium]